MAYQKGTDGYAQAKAVKTFCIAVTLVTLAMAVLFIAPSHNFFHAHWVVASGAWHIGALVSIAANLVFCWVVLRKVMNDEVYSGAWVYWVTIMWLLFDVCCLAAFNFSIG